jgi:hypothetical protein
MAVTTWPPARLLTTPNNGIGAVGWNRDRPHADQIIAGAGSFSVHSMNFSIVALPDPPRQATRLEKQLQRDGTAAR